MPKNSISVDKIQTETSSVENRLHHFAILFVFSLHFFQTHVSQSDYVFYIPHVVLLVHSTGQRSQARAVYTGSKDNYWTKGNENSLKTKRLLRDPRSNLSTFFDELILIQICTLIGFKDPNFWGHLPSLVRRRGVTFQAITHDRPTDRPTALNRVTANTVPFYTGSTVYG